MSGVLFRADIARRLKGAPASRHRLAYSITSSARCWRNRGTSRLSAFAVFRLMTSSNFVPIWTGQIGGLTALEDAVEVARAAPVQLRKINAAKQMTAAADGKKPKCGDRPQTIPDRRCTDEIAMGCICWRWQTLQDRRFHCARFPRSPPRIRRLC